MRPFDMSGFPSAGQAASAALGDVYAYLNGSLIGSVRNVVLPTGLMARAAAFQSDNATGTHTLSVDYISALFER